MFLNMNWLAGVYAAILRYQGGVVEQDGGVQSVRQLGHSNIFKN